MVGGESVACRGKSDGVAARGIYLASFTKVGITKKMLLKDNYEGI